VTSDSCPNHTLVSHVGVFHPYSQILQEYPEMKELQEEFNNEVKCHYQTVKTGHGECRPGFSPQNVNLLFDSIDSILAMS
jgi:hypothetical protein